MSIEFLHIFDDEIIYKFVEKYSKPPTQTVLEIEIQNRRDLSETENTSASSSPP